ncbi:unnamed protein product [Dimorphilus gyrociliatus]|uniref:Uncharacterized protein n=1 Tax=Dimorphilus gyrociliatus TaxID=2664684 RepID=A0A7I8V517_9ANNE|nr:unnamed protein product [Dimorphilus gyrociliatus]
MISKVGKSFASIPGPKGLPFFGNLLNYTIFGNYTIDRLADAYVHYRRKYGDIFKEDLGSVTFVHVANPQEIVKVMQNESKYPIRTLLPIFEALNKYNNYELGLMGNGENWWKSRQPIQKIMAHPTAASAYLETQIAVSNDFVDYIKSKSDENGLLPDSLEDITNYAMESIGTVAFGIRLGALRMYPNPENKEFVILMKRYFDMIAKSCFTIPLFLHFQTPFYKEFLAIKERIDEICKGFLENGRREEYNKDLNIIASLSNISWTERQKIDLAITLLQAGVESTANSLCFLLYNLSQNQQVQEKLHKEIDTVIGKNELKFDDINKLNYLKACLKESFRIYFPTIAGTNRIIGKTMKIGDYEIPSGTRLVINCEAIAKSKTYFENAMEYKPERWLTSSGERRKIPTGCLLPFGYGRRMCIGRRFAEQEIYLAVIKLLQNFRIEENGIEKLGTKTSVFKKPDRKVNFRFIVRNPVT